MSDDEMRMLLPDRPPTPLEGAAAGWVLTAKIEERACSHIDPVRVEPAYVFLAGDVRAFVCATCADPYLVQLWDSTQVHECGHCHKADAGKPGIARTRVKPAPMYVLWALCDPCKTKLLRIDRSKPIRWL